MPKAQNRGITKWAALLCSVLITAMMVYSAWHFTSCPLGGDLEIYTLCGQIGLNNTAQDQSRLTHDQDFGFYFWCQWSEFAGAWWASIPMWPLALLTLLWTCVAWRKDILITSFGAPNSKPRRWLKWLSAATAAALAFVWIGSIWYGFYVYGPSAFCGIDEGTLYLVEDPRTHEPLWDWSLSRSPRPSIRWEASHGTSNGYPFADIPLWPFLTLALTLTAATWWLDLLARRRGHTTHAHCHSCQYDRTGLPATAPCPECGTQPHLPRPA